MAATRKRPRSAVVAACLAVAGAVALHAGLALPSAQHVPAPAVRIISPHGRLASTGPIRIVAQVDLPKNRALDRVEFFVDDVLVGEDVEGPIHAVEWHDDNPFVPIAIRVRATDTAGAAHEDHVSLPALEVTDETSIASVLLEVAVFDVDGRHVPGMTREHFVLLEDGAAQDLDMVTPDTVPTTVTLLLDASQSMAYRFDFVRRAATRLVTLLRPDDQLAVIPFSKTLGPLTGPTRDIAAIDDAIEAIEVGGGTAIADALSELARRLADAPGRQVLVLLTDGYDEHSSTGLAQAVAAIRRMRGTLYAVGIGGVAGISLRGRDALKAMAQETGGRAFFPTREQELPLVQEHVAADVQHRYLLSYTPLNQARDGRWRSIALRTGNPDHVIQTRQGYFAATPPPIRPSIEFTVSDPARQRVVIGPSDVTVTEDEVVQTVESFQEAVAPVTILMALDQSGSMRRAAASVQDAATAFIDALRPEDRLGVVSFHDTATMAADVSTSRVLAREAVGRYVAAGGTALYDALGIAMDRLATVNGRRAIVVLTDGRDENNPGTAPGSRRTIDDVLAQLREVDVAVFTIGLGPQVDRRTLERIAEASGGEAYFPAFAEELADDYRRVVDDLRRRYVLSYTSTNGVRDGRWRHVTLSSPTGDLVFRSRGGYQAPGS
jgi:Ca-activated chloride channel homolog